MSSQSPPLTSHVVVFGASAPKEGEPLWNLSVELGDKLAQCGYSICSGGYGGTMEAVSKGASQHPNIDIKGVISSKTFYKRHEQGNKYLRTTVDADNLHERIKGLTDSGNYFVVLPGSLGTAAELLIVWNLYYINSVFPASVEPVRKIFVFRDPWEKIINFIGDELKVHSDLLKAFVFVDTVDEIISGLNQLVRQ
ncbi:hypothetical protein C9374_006664 [Naegleria lovaniensis]|uniref:LOG family protein n=1 Tax=Naegleria lovaniensis TaxID=51637 RepID=A0AA88GLD9_NAELO|nr:uncharacterized protein C9374_006664 [Naegleria lovaniensis]KAG2379547.1 hypothetical protein C9374_006664 [Naegleria lovaniensis]